MRSTCDSLNSSSGMWQRMTCPSAANWPGGVSSSQIDPTRRGQRRWKQQPRAGGSASCTSLASRRARNRLRHRCQQGLGVGMVGRCVDVRHWPHLAHPALIEHGHPVGDGADDGQVVRDKEIGHAPIGLESSQQLQDSSLNRNIERGGHFVTQHQVRLGGKGTRDGHPLFFAAGHLAGIPFQIAWGEPHLFEQRARPLQAPFSVRLEIKPQRDIEKLLDGMARVEGRVRVLEDDLDFAARLSWTAFDN